MVFQEFRELAVLTQSGTKASSHLDSTIPPMSMAPAHPNCFRTEMTSRFACGSFPQISISTLLSPGLTIREFGTVLKHFTTLAWGSFL